MLTTLALTLPVFALIGAGYAWGRWRKLGEDAVALLNGYVVWLALPVLLFDFVAGSGGAMTGAGRFALVFGSGMGIAFAAGLLAGGRERPLADRAIDALASGYPNAAYLGIPLMTALLGPVGTAAAVVAGLLTVSFLFAITILLVELDLRRGAGLARAAGGVALAVLRNPLVAAPLAGVAWALTGVALPAPLAAFAGLLGQSASPVALVTIGVFLAVPRPRADGALTGRVLALKLAGQPLATAALLLLVPLPPLWAPAAILLAALPTGTGPFMVAQLYDRDVGLSAHVILLSTLIGLASVSLLAWWLVR